MDSYLNINTEQLQAALKTPAEEPVVMLNLVRYKEKIAETGLTGKEGYKEYMRQATPFFQKAKAKVLFYGSPEYMLIGPEDETLWDDVLLVRYDSISDFINMVKADGYPLHLRAQALSDSRLIHCSAH